MSLKASGGFRRCLTRTLLALACAGGAIAVMRSGDAPVPPTQLAAVLDLARAREADLPLPAGFAVRDLGARYGYYNPFTDRVVVDDYFLGGNDCARMRKLYEILVHEAWHRREPLRALLAPWRHPHIDAAAARRAALAAPAISACAAGTATPESAGS